MFKFLYVHCYRPIALIPVLAKVYKKVMFVQLVEYLEMHHLLILRQFGFKKGKSIVLAVESLLDQILNCFESRQSTLVVLCDISFNCVSHSILYVD